MHPDTERRLVRALQTDTPWPHLAKMWGISTRHLQRIANKHGVKKKQVIWEEFLRSQYKKGEQSA